MKKTIASITVLLFLAIYGLNVYASDIYLDTGRADEGIVGITYQAEEGMRYKVMISKGTEQYYYDYFGSGTEYFPLQCGSGNYTVSVLENVTGTKYKVLRTATIHVNLCSETEVYLQSIQNIKWNSDMNAVFKASELTRKLTAEDEKVKAIYDYIVANIDYDYKKTDSLKAIYVPNVEDTFETGKGICYDYSALFASMLRSQGIPAKLVKGYSENVDGYHAWNEVLINGKWVTIDTTYDAVMRCYGEATGFEKNKTEYQIARIY